MSEQKRNETNTSLLEVKDLVVEYTSEGDIIQAVNKVSFSLDRGKTLGLVGETGAGKTSIAKAILRILPEFAARVKGGQILFEGRDLLQIHNTEMSKIRGKKISMIFQDPMTALNPVMRVGEQISEVVRLHNKVSKAEARARGVKMLEMVGIPAERYNEYPHQFSGGMKQRVVIAMALACDPELLLADEPTTALDVTIQAQVLDMINRLKNEYNTAMIVISHDLGVIAEVCDDVAVVYGGKIVEYGTKEEIYTNPSHPYTKGLFGALPDLNADVERLSPIEGLPPDAANLPEGCSFHPRCPHAVESCKKGQIKAVSLGGRHTCRCCNMGGEK